MLIVRVTMALNKFMHPRNIYKNPPDFSKLADKFEEFSKIANVDVSGRVSVDFKDPKALRVLTKCLLKSDFNIDVFIPEDRLVPTLPLRLNYILWLEDLLSAINRQDNIRGLDVGTGACAIYPLLAATKNKWNMVGTESDEESFKNATNNVERNSLQNLIELRKNAATSIFEFLCSEDNTEIFDFSMCNPPFYTNLQELWESRSPARPPPKNGFTGSPQELITEGGELYFCRKMITESKKIPNKILIFTTMVGHKYNLKELLIDLKADGIKHTTTEFCQGRVTRWGLAWTYQEYNFSKLQMIRDKGRKKNLPLSFDLPAIENTSLVSVVETVKTILNNLKIKYRFLNKKYDEITLDIVAHTNTWSNQRRKRRLLQRMANEEAKVMKIDEKCIPSTPNKNERLEKESEVTENKTEQPECSKSEPVQQANTVSILHATMKILVKDKNIHIEMLFLSGDAGKEGLHQIIQYIKNNWK